MSGPTRHNNQLHRSEDAAGDPIPDGYVPAADGLGNWVWLDPTTLPPPTVALDDLTDVTITGVADDDTLQRIGGVWVNTRRRWEPVTFDPGSGPEIVFTATDIVMTWETY